MTSMSTEFPEFHNKVRFDAETKRGSVLDVIKLMTGMTSNNIDRVFKSMTEKHPELFNQFSRCRINGKVSLFFSTLLISYSCL